MILSSTEYNAYLNVHLDLLYFTGKRSNILKAETSFKEFKELPLKKKFECRQCFNEHPEILEVFLKQHRCKLSGKQIEILGRFFNLITICEIRLNCANNSGANWFFVNFGESF